jgi:serine/threonine protein kinase
VCASEAYQAAWLLLAAAERPVVLDFVLPDSTLDSEEMRWLRNTWATEVVNARLLLQTSNRAYSAPGLHAFEPSNVRFEERYCSGKVIGAGAFSTVHSATCLQTGRLVAVKRVAKLRLSSREAERLHSEVTILRKCRHPHVVALINHFETPATTYLVMELLPGGDIFEQVIRRFGRATDETDESGYTEGDACDIMRMALSAVAHLHELRIVHRDIKPENVLLTQDGGRGTELKLADFGCARLLRDGEACHERVGTPGYMAPELVMGSQYAFPVDVWSLGVLAFMLLSGCAPFDTSDAQLEERQVCTGCRSCFDPNQP